MRHHPLLINIPEPCGEDWDAMADRGQNLRYCDVCQHSLTDFTGMTDREVHQTLQDNNGRICGRFRPDQVGRPILAAPVHAPKWRGWLTAASILLSGSIAAQLAEPPACGITTPAPTKAAGVPVNLSGIVTSDDGEALVGATVVVTHKGNFYRGTVTAIDGSFLLENIPSNAVVTLSYIGYEDHVVDLIGKEIFQNNFLDIVMQIDAYVLEQVVVTAYSRTLKGKVALTGYVKALPTKKIPFVEPQPIHNYLEQTTIYPNPFTDRLFLDFATEHPGNITAELTGPNGRLIKRWLAMDFTAGKNHLQLRLREVGTLIPGHYFLQLTDGDGRTETRVVIKGSR